MGTKTILGNREHKKINARFGGTGEQNNYFRETREQVPSMGLGLKFEKNKC